MAATSGRALLEPEASAALIRCLLPQTTLLTPNLHEAAALLNEPIANTTDDLVRQAQRLRALGPEAVLIKGGHGKGDEAADLYCDGEGVRTYALPWIDTPNRHGTGCTRRRRLTCKAHSNAPRPPVSGQGRGRSRISRKNNIRRPVRAEDVMRAADAGALDSAGNHAHADPC
jgi:hydroxymethylpyrimidine/phosphomethylpyrimidine kinase